MARQPSLGKGQSVNNWRLLQSMMGDLIARSPFRRGHSLVGLSKWWLASLPVPPTQIPAEAKIWAFLKPQKWITPWNIF
jgi:hypothetical protein